MFSLQLLSKYNMPSCNNDHTDYKNNGLITKIWGEPGWTFCHSVTFGYPVEPSEKKKKDYKDFFVSLGNVLPCRWCRESYQEFITTKGKTELNDNVLRNRDTLTEWFYDIHNAVNDKLEVEYAVTYSDTVDRFESFRAKCGKPTKTARGCVTPLDYKAFSFKNLYYRDAPVVSYDAIKPFIMLARYRGLDNIYFVYLNTIDYFDGDISRLKKWDAWIERNKFCQKHIKYMREYGIPSIEEHGKWKGTPTMDELILLMFMCSNLNRTELREATNNLDAIRNRMIY